MTSIYDDDIIAEFGTATPEHGSRQLYENAWNCGHPEPPEGSDAWDKWKDDHPNCTGFNAEPICLLTPADTFCPACTVAARDDEDLPSDDYVPCRQAAPADPDTRTGR